MDDQQLSELLRRLKRADTLEGLVEISIGIIGEFTKDQNVDLELIAIIFEMLSYTVIIRSKYILRHKYDSDLEDFYIDMEYLLESNDNEVARFILACILIPNGFIRVKQVRDLISEGFSQDLQDAFWGAILANPEAMKLDLLREAVENISLSIHTLRVLILARATLQKMRRVSSSNDRKIALQEIVDILNEKFTAHLPSVVEDVLHVASDFELEVLAYEDYPDSRRHNLWVVRILYFLLAHDAGLSMKYLLWVEERNLDSEVRQWVAHKKSRLN